MTISRILAAGALCAVLAGPAWAETLMVNAAAVRVRVQPATTAPEAGRLALGTTVDAGAASGQGADRWRQVSGPAAGWVAARFLAPVDPADPAPAYLAIAQQKLAPADAPFGDMVELTQMLDRAAAEAPRHRHELQFQALVALGRSFKAMQGQNDTPAHAAWIKAQEARAVYSEPAGEWYVRAGLLWDLEKLNSGTALGERIAWEAAHVDLPGECEGYMPCYLTYLAEQEGEYLARYPKGAHAAEAMAVVDQQLAEAVKGEDVNRDFGDYDSDLYEVCVRLDTQLAKVAGAARARAALQTLIGRVPPAKRHVRAPED